MNTENILLTAFSAYITKTVCDCEPVTDEMFAAFIKKAAQHKVLPMVYEKLVADGKLLLNKQNMNIISTAVKHSIVTQTLKTYSFIELYNNLLNLGVTPLCIKGVACRVNYPKPDLRASGDEDLLVSLSEKERCCNELIRLGYEPENDENSYETGFVNKNNGYRIELHTKLFSPENPFFSSFNTALGNMYENISCVNVYATDIYCPSDNKHLLYLVLHAFKHFIYAGVGIRQVCDIALFAKKSDINWPYIFEKCKSVNASVFLTAILLISEKYFGLSLNAVKNTVPDFNCTLDISNILHDIMSGALYGADSLNRQHSATITLNYVESQANGTKSNVLASVFPAAEKIKDRYPYLQKHPLLLPFAWAQRIASFSKSESSSAQVVKTGEKRIALLKEYGISENE